MALSAIRSKYETAGFLTWFSILNPFHRHLFAQFINHYNEKYYSCFVFGKINIKNAKKAENSCMSVDPWALTICMKIWWNFFVKWYWCFFHTENRKGMKPDTYNPNKRKFCSFRYKGEKGNTSDPESVTFFSEIISPGWTVPHEFSPELPDFPNKWWALVIFPLG